MILFFIKFSVTQTLNLTADFSIYYWVLLKRDWEVWSEKNQEQDCVFVQTHDSFSLLKNKLMMTHGKTLKLWALVQLKL